MPNDSAWGERHSRVTPSLQGDGPQAAPGAPAFPEPEMRRWPHPVEGAAPVRETDPTLHYIRCALSYQNQALADIKALLEQLVLNTAPKTEEK